MSGGSWEYLYSNVDDAACRLCADKDALRRAFGKHLKDVALALHDIEWVDSCDFKPGDERASIEKALGEHSDSAELSELAAEAKRLISQLERFSKLA